MWYQYIDKTCISFKRLGPIYGKVHYNDTVQRTGYFVVKHLMDGTMIVVSALMNRTDAIDALRFTAGNDFANYAWYGLLKVKTRTDENGTIYSITWNRGKR